MDKINWVEAFAIDPRTNEKYYARVNEDDFNPKQMAFYEAYKRAVVVAHRGFKGVNDVRKLDEQQS